MAVTIYWDGKKLLLCMDYFSSTRRVYAPYMFPTRRRSIVLFLCSSHIISKTLAAATRLLVIIFAQPWWSKPGRTKELTLQNQEKITPKAYAFFARPYSGILDAATLDPETHARYIIERYFASYRERERLQKLKPLLPHKENKS